LVISNPVQARHVLRDANVKYDKYVLAEIEAITGKALTHTDPETWSVRRRQIVPAFHKPWLVDIATNHSSKHKMNYANNPMVIVNAKWKLTFVWWH
jgi:hypothetical protein